MLDQWWGPKPYRAETKTMDFSEGRHWLYAMVSPENEKHWGKIEYKSIEKEKYFIQTDGFCDENGNMNPDLPQNEMKTSYQAKENKTLMEILLTFDSTDDIDTTIEMGFKEGITICFEQLDELTSDMK